MGWAHTHLPAGSQSCEPGGGKWMPDKHIKRFRLPCPADAAEEKKEPGASLVEDPRPAGRSGLSSSFPILSFHLALRLATCLSF